MKRTVPILIVLFLITTANALVYYQQDWTNNGNSALILDEVSAPFEPNCIVAFGNSVHDLYINSTVISPNFVLSAKHWPFTRLGCRIKNIGNTNLYLGKDSNGIAQYNDIYVIADYRALSGTDIIIYKIKKAINPADPDIPDPNEDSGYDWINDPNGYFDDANLESYTPLYIKTDEDGKDIVIAGYGPQRIFGVHNLGPSPTEYAVAPGILHWGYNQISGTDSAKIYLFFDDEASSGEVPNEVWAGYSDSGSGWYIWDEFDERYKVATTFWWPSGGPRVSSYIDDIAQNVAAMGTPTLPDMVLAGLEPTLSVAYELENGASGLNPVNPDADDLTITMTADDLADFIAVGADHLVFVVDIPYEFDVSPDNSDFAWNISTGKFSCTVDLQSINPNDPVTRTAVLRVNHFAEPMTSVEVTTSVAIDDLIKVPSNISCDIANWSDPDSEPGVVYVNDDAAISTSGTSWEYPYKTLQDAIARAIKSGSGIDTIWLAAGTYTADDGESFAINKNIEIYGGFVGSESNPNQRSNVGGKTVITVSDQYQDVFWMSTEGAQREYVLDGLTITGSGQNGIYLRRNTLDVRHCVITGNGAGIAGNNAALTIQDSVLTYNGVGLDMSYSGIALDRNVFAFNEEEGIKLNTIGFFIGNSVISENQSNGLYFVSPSGTEILNCNIINNDGYGIYGLTGGATTKIKNCVVFGNNDDTIPTGTYIYSNIQTDPPFWFPYVADSAYVKYQLSPDATSCIDTGNNAAIYDYPLDLYGQDRVVNSVVDIGAVESLPVSDCDFNVDGVVNFIDYAEFAGVWLLDSNAPNYDVRYDFDTDGYIDVNDLCTFAENWLYGIVSTGTVTSTYQVDFGYRAPEIGMMMMSMPTIEPESISLYPLDDVADVPVNERFEVAKNRLGITELATQETMIPCIVPKINLIQQEREQKLQQIENIPILLEWLDEIWLNGELNEIWTEKEYIEFRESIGRF